MEQITSRRNPIVARFREITRSATPTGSTVLLEGPRLIEEALAAGVPIDLAAVSTGTATAHRAAAVLDQLDPALTRLVRVSPAVMEALSPVSTPSGFVALATLLPVGFDAAAPPPQPLVVGLLGVQDPGNTGAVIRAVEAGGATGVITVGGADPYGWKALRGSMGSAFRQPVVTADEVVSIPMHPSVDSLNIAVAAALIVYEAAGQRAGATAREGGRFA